MKRFLTEYTAEDGSACAGPLILADSEEMAQALLVCLLGPTGQSLRLLGELVGQIYVDPSDIRASFPLTH